jgi:hypothetical protein
MPAKALECAVARFGVDSYPNNSLRSLIMSAKVILSEVFLAVVLSHAIVFFGSFLWENSGLIWVALPIIASFILGSQITRLFFIYKGE